MKKKNIKKHLFENIKEKAVKIKCQYCDIKDTCPHRVSKEKSEQYGFKTFCTITPNRPKSFLKKAGKK